MAYKVKSAFRPSERKKRALEKVEINLTPIMNLVVILIPLLLQAIVLIKLGRIDYKPPPLPEEAEEISSEVEGGGGEPEMLNLVLQVVDSSLRVSIFNATSGEGFWNISLTPEGEYDFAELQRVLLDIKKNKVGEPTDWTTETDSLTQEQIRKPVYKFTDAKIVRIAATPDIEYQSIVTLLDATYDVISDGIREELFPQPILGQIGLVLID